MANGYIIAAAVLFSLYVIAELFKAVETALIFQPTPDISPHIRLPGEMIFVLPDGRGRINAAVIRGEGSEGGNAVFAHGNAGNIVVDFHLYSSLLPFFRTVVIFDYRGYGRSKGGCGWTGVSEATVVEDFLFVARRCFEMDRGRWTVIGHSLGGGVVAQGVAQMTDEERRRVERVFVVATFTSIRDVATSIGIPPLVLLPLRSRFDSLRAWRTVARKGGVRGCVVVAARDDVLPSSAEMGASLATEMGWRLLTVPETDHMTVLSRPGGWLAGAGMDQR